MFKPFITVPGIMTNVQFNSFLDNYTPNAWAICEVVNAKGEPGRRLAVSTNETDAIRVAAALEGVPEGILEVVADIAYDLGFTHHRLGSEEPDSRENIDFIIRAAHEFQSRHANTDWEADNYLDEIEAFIIGLRKNAFNEPEFVDGLSEALDIVIQLASDNVIDPRHCSEDTAEEQAAKQWASIGTVESFVKNHLGVPPAAPTLSPAQSPDKWVTITVPKVDLIQLREQRDYLLTLPDSDCVDGLTNLLDSMLDIAEDAPLSEPQGQAIIDLLWDSLKRDPAHKDRRQTAWGTKTKEGLIKCIERIASRPESLPAPSMVIYRCSRCGLEVTEKEFTLLSECCGKSVNKEVRY